MVEKIPAVLKILPQVLRGIFFDSHCTLDEWSPVSTDEVEKFISSALSKTCQLDPAPTWLVKDMGGLLSPFVALLVNK